MACNVIESDDEAELMNELILQENNNDDDIDGSSNFTLNGK